MDATAFHSVIIIIIIFTIFGSDYYRVVL